MDMMTTTRVITFSDSQKMSRFAADLLAQTAQEAAAQRGRFLLALSGGSTPGLLYRLLAQAPYRQYLPWGKMLFFWGDERCVPPDDPESSYHLAHETFLSQVPVLDSNIYRIKGELEPRAAAADYARALEKLAPANLGWPSFDMALLGIGADGHTASLFPGSAETHGLSTVAVEAHYEDRPARRVSLTPDVFNSARNVVFLAAGPEKAAALAATLAGGRDTLNHPAQRIRPVNGKLWFLVDEQAASLLPEEIHGTDLHHMQD